MLQNCLPLAKEKLNYKMLRHRPHGQLGNAARLWLKLILRLKLNCKP